MNEERAVALFDALAETLDAAGVDIGIGDDAAVLTLPPGHALVACVDTLNVGTHFLEDQPPESIGHRALAANLSDLAAMGATPRWVLLSVSMPRAEFAWLEGFARGFGALAARHAVGLAGGDTTRGAWSISVTALGAVPHGEALQRGTARPGDRLWVSGTPGDAALGLRDPASTVRDRLLYPTPRVALGQGLRGLASACIDLSDGIAIDIPRLAGSRGVTLDASSLPLSRALAERSDGWRLALAGGDDFELCFTAGADSDDQVRATAAAAATPVAAIGTVTDDVEHRVVLPDGGYASLSDFSGFEHFS